MTFENILLEKKNAIAYVTVNRPKVLNALSLATMQELGVAFQEIKNDVAIRVAILTGSGEKAFVAGGEDGGDGEKDAAPGQEEEPNRGRGGGPRPVQVRSGRGVCH